MNNLKRLVVSLSLMSVLAITAFAGETSSPPCMDPGILQTPPAPCSSAQMTTDDSTAPGETATPPGTDAPDVSTIITDALIALLF